MNPDNIEYLKWFIAIPGAFIATITIPWVIKKNYLECKKLSLEIEILKRQLNRTEQSSNGEPSEFLKFFARYWPVFDYGSMAILLILGIAIKSNLLIFSSFILSFVLFVAGSSAEEHYKEILRTIKKS